MQLFGDVFIPLDDRVADIVAAQDQIRLRNVLRFGILEIHVAHIDPRIGA